MTNFIKLETFLKWKLPGKFTKRDLLNDDVGHTRYTLDIKLLPENFETFVKDINMSHLNHGRVCYELNVLPNNMVKITSWILLNKRGAQ